jgi:hypothetical protein
MQNADHLESGKGHATVVKDSTNFRGSGRTQISNYLIVGHQKIQK